ncbi:type II toxin-antitoxin system HigB family toxin [Burkholderia sp. M6-3]
MSRGFRELRCSAIQTCFSRGSIIEQVAGRCHPSGYPGGGASVGHGRLDTRSSTRRQPARIVAAIHYNRQSLFVRHVVTHASTTFGRG